MAVAQELRVQGLVRDTSGEPVIGATVSVKGEAGGRAMTDLDGKFEIDKVNAGAVLVFSFIGMEKTEARAKAKMDVVMHDAEEVMQEVLVTAFGQQTRESFTGSAAVVGSDVLEKRQLTNALSGLEGQVAGVQMINNSGDPSAEPTIRIRGFSSINAGNDPLIILDGAPYDGSFTSINPSDVASVTVLKDAASNALYGARGANGVILITTKSGNKGEGKTTISLDAKWGVNKDATIDYDYIKEPGSYYEMYYKALKAYYLNQGQSVYAAHTNANATLAKNSSENGLGYIAYAVPGGQSLIGENGRLNPNAVLGNRVYNNGAFYTVMPDDWLKAAYSTALRQEYNVNVTTSGEKAQLYASLGYLNNEGVAVNTGFERYSARLKANWTATKWMSMGGSIGYMHSQYKNVADGTDGDNNLFYMLRRMAPIYPLYLRDGNGNIMMDSNGQMYDYGDGEVNGLIRPEMSQTNMIQESWLNTNKSTSSEFNLSGHVDITPVKGLTLTVNGTVTSDADKSTYAMNPFYGYSAVSFDNGYVSASQGSMLSLNFQQLANYTVSFGKNTVRLLLGHESYKYSYEYLFGGKQNMVSYFDNQTLGGAISLYSTSDSHTNYNNEGYLFRGMYDWDERYFASVSYRRDASSRFHPDYRWGNFYSLGGAWIMSKESWLKPVKWIDMLKLKASIGQQGNDNIGDFRYTDLYAIVNSAGNLGLQYYSKGNKKITWETNTNFNAGVEFDLWKGRLSGSVEYFFRRTTDMLFFLSAPRSAGYTGSYHNIGNMDNSGIEIDLTSNVLKTKHWKWDVNLNATHFKNKIKSLAPGIKNTTIAGGEKGRLSGNQILCEGHALYTWCMPKYAGVSEDGLSQWYTADGGVTTDYSIAKSNENLQLCGTAIPKLYGGFGTSLSVYGVDLSISFNYSLGGKAYDYGYASMMTNPNTSSTGYNIHKDMYDAWSETNTTSDIPRFVFGDEDAAAVSSRFLTNASYLTLQNINVGYTLPQVWLKKLHISSLRVFGAADNIYYWSKRKGFDPRGAFSGAISTTTYSPVRSFSAGINIQF